MNMQNWRSFLDTSIDYISRFTVAFNDFASGWKIFISFVVVLIGLYVMPEGKAQYIVATAGIVFGAYSRKAQSVAKNKKQ